MRRFYHLAAVVVTAISFARPAAAQVAVLGSGVFEHDASPGQTYQGRVLVRNDTKEPQEAKVYQTDYSFAADGRTMYDAPGTSRRSNAKWVSVSSNYLVIPPETTVPVTFSVAVPADSSLRGTYWSLVMIEAIVPGSPESRKANARVQVGLNVTTRYATQIATNVGTGTSHLAFDSLMVTDAQNGARGLRYDFINTGEQAHRFTMSLELYNEAGELVKTAKQTRGLLYPGTAARQQFELGSVPHGAYTAVLVADGGGDQVFGGQFKVTY